MCSLEVLDSLRAHVVDLGLELNKDGVDTDEDWVICDTSGSACCIVVISIRSVVHLRTKCFAILTCHTGSSTLSSCEEATAAHGTFLSGKPFLSGNLLDSLDLVFVSIGIRNGSFAPIDILKHAEHVIKLNETHLVSKQVSKL